MSYGNACPSNLINTVHNTEQGCKLALFFIALKINLRIDTVRSGVIIQISKVDFSRAILRYIKIFQKQMNDNNNSLYSGFWINGL